MCRSVCSSCRWGTRLQKLTDLFFAVGLEQRQRHVFTVSSSLPPRGVTLEQMYPFPISQDSPVLEKGLPRRLTALVADDMQVVSEAKGDYRSRSRRVSTFGCGFGLNG